MSIFDDTRAKGPQPFKGLRMWHDSIMRLNGGRGFKMLGLAEGPEPEPIDPGWVALSQWVSARLDGPPVHVRPETAGLADYVYRAGVAPCYIVEGDKATVSIANPEAPVKVTVAGGDQEMMSVVPPEIPPVKKFVVALPKDKAAGAKDKIWAAAEVALDAWPEGEEVYGVVVSAKNSRGKLAKRAREENVPLITFAKLEEHL